MDLKTAKKIIEKALMDKGFYSESAVNLLLGTMAVESDFGRFRRQTGGGPALGIFQMEKPTFDWLKEKYGDDYALNRYEFEDLETNHALAAIFARLRYLVVEEKLPKAGDIKALSKYWKKHYNTPKGKGSTDDFVEKYTAYVLKG